jgi:hypothetical protein
VIAEQAPMAQPPHSPNTFRRRRSRGFQPAASLLAARVQKAAEGRGFAVTRLLTHWSEIAGPQIAAVTRPVRISHGREEIYGYNAIQRITLTQTAAQGFAEGQAQFVHAPKTPPAPDPVRVQHAAQVGAQFTDPTLAEAMARLALNVTSRNSRKT